MRIRVAALLASCALAGISAGARAQDSETGDGTSAGERSGLGTTIVVTAERRETNIQETPLSIIAMTSEMVEAKGIDDLQDLARFTPNLSITPTRGGGNNSANFVIRGIGGGGGSTGERGVGLYVDGVYMPRTSGAVLRVMDIERVEVLRGPQGTLFGRNSTGGAIRIFSQQPTQEAGGYVKGTLGTHGRTDLIGMMNLPITDTLAIRLQGASLEQGGYVTRGTEKLGESRDVIARFQAKFEPSSSITAALGVYYTESRANGTPYVMTEFDMRPGIDGVIQGNYADLINDAFKAAGQAPLAAYNDSRIVTGDPYTASSLCFMDDFNPDYDAACNQFSNDDYFQADLNLSIDLSDTLSVSTVTGYSNLKHTGLTDFQVLGTESRTENVDSEVFYQELQLNAELLDGAIDLVTGGSYFWEDADAPNFGITRRHSSVFPSNPGTPPNADLGLFRQADSDVGQVSKSYGLFASGTWHVTDQLNVTAGVRRAWDEKYYTQTRYRSFGFTPPVGVNSVFVESNASFSAWDWRGTADYQFTDDVMAYATVSKAYKAGSFSYTINATADPAGQSAAINPIPNERVINYEAGLRMDLFDGMLRLNPTAFRMDFTNRQAAVQVTCGTGVLTGIVPNSAECPVGFLILLQNQGNVKLEGVEVDGLLSIMDNLLIDGSFAMFKPTLSNAPAGTVNLFPDAPSPTFNVGATWTHQIAASELRLIANYAWQGKMETHPTSGTDSAYTLPSYGLLNARAQIALDNVPVTFTVYSTNLLGKDYATYAQRFGGGFWDSGAGTGLAAPLRSALSEVRGRPREVGVTLQIDF